MKAKVAIIMGSQSDWEVMKEASEMLKKFHIVHTQQVLSAHRMPEDLSVFAKASEENSIQCIIAGAGGAAHLPGMMAAFTIIPVIGVPMKTQALGGVDSLYSIVQMPKGVPVATMGINQSANAALMAVRILALQNEKIKSQLLEFRHEEYLRAKMMALD